MPAFRFNKKIGPVRGVRAFFDLEVGATRRMTENSRQSEQSGKLEAANKEIERQWRLLAEKERQITRLRMRVSTAGGGSMRPPQGKDTTETGALPDFLILGTQKGGTTFLYYLLNQHPFVEAAAKKEINYFDVNFSEGENWYRSHFPALTWKDARKVVSGEASPYYLYHPHAARRAARMVPEARLVALLRNPVERAYSEYHHRLREGRETLGLEQAVDAEEERLYGEREKMLANEDYVSPNHRKFSYLSRGIYIDQIQEWHRYFGRDQLLILKSEAFLKDPTGIFDKTSKFLGLPDWKPTEEEIASGSPTRHQGNYPPMAAETRRRLEKFFEPHNQRLYEYLGVDFGW